MHVQEISGAPLGANELWVAVAAEPYDVTTGTAGGNAEQRATLSFNVPAIEARGEHWARTSLQVDPGHWHVTADLWTHGTAAVIDKAEGDVTVEGHHARDVSFSKDVTFDVVVVITHLARVGPTLYQVHFVLSNLSATQPVPAGLPVTGVLESDGGDTASQDYDLPAPIGPGASAQTYLTLEGHSVGTLTAVIRVDAGGESRAESAPLVMAAEQVPHAPEHQAAQHQAAQRQAEAEPGQDPASAIPPFPTVSTGVEPDEGEDLTRDWVVGAAHTAAEFASWFLKHGSRALAIVESAGVVLEAIELYDMFSAVIAAFQEDLGDAKRDGYIYGLLWGVLGSPTKAPTRNLASMGIYMHTFEERSEAFLEGVQEGRARVQSDVNLHNSIAALIAYKMAYEHLDQYWASDAVLNELGKQGGWHKARTIDMPELDA